MNNIFLYWENLNGSKTPDYIDLCKESIIKYNSNDFNIILVNEKNLSDYIDIHPSLLKIKKLAQKCDVIRVALLYNHGGIWLDSDCINLKSLTEVYGLLESYDYIGYYNKQNAIANGLMCSKKKCPFITDVYQYLLTKIEEKNDFGWEELGSIALNKFHKKHNNELYIFDKSYMSFIDWDKWNTFFKDYDTNYIPEHSYTAMLFNEMFKINNINLLKMNKQQILNQNNLLGKLFRQNT